MRELIFASIALCISASFLGVSLIHGPNLSSRPVQQNDQSLPVYTSDTLQAYNGENSELPILLALNGYVYDVTAGKEYYEPGAVYHNLAGKDSSELLNAIGGDIITRKYQVVGVYK